MRRFTSVAFAIAAVLMLPSGAHAATGCRPIRAYSIELSADHIQIAGGRCTTADRVVHHFAHFHFAHRLTANGHRFVCRGRVHPRGQYEGIYCYTRHARIRVTARLYS